MVTHQVVIEELISPPGWDPTDRYLDLLKRSLTRIGLDKPGLEPIPKTSSVSGRRRSQFNARGRVLYQLDGLLGRRGYGIGRRIDRIDLAARFEGADWPAQAETMVGWRRLQQVHEALDTIQREGIRGDLLEAGVWRGGVVIFMAAYLGIHGSSDRLVYAADSFEGLPPPDDRYEADIGDVHHTWDYLAVSQSEVERNFAAYGVPLNQVHFVPGYFEQTLPNLAVDQLALLRIDGDMYSSTIHVLDALYDKVVDGGFVIMDDYGLVGAQSAVHDFLHDRRIDPVWVPIDSMSAYFRKV